MLKTIEGPNIYISFQPSDYGLKCDILVWDQLNDQFLNVCGCILDAFWVMVIRERVYFHFCLHQTFTPCMLGEKETLFLLFGECICTNQLSKIRQR